MSLLRSVSLGAFAVIVAGGLLAAQAIAPAPARAMTLVPSTQPVGPTTAFTDGDGLVVTVPAGQDVLSTLAMTLAPSGAAPANVDFQLFAWDAAGHAPTGPLLGTTNTVSVPQGGVIATTTFTWTGATVVPGNQYLIVFQTDSPVVAESALGAGVEYKQTGATWTSQQPHHLEQLLFLQTPVITALSEQTGTPGDTVTITGAGFTGATAVAFGGVNASDFTVVSDTRITLTVPAGVAAGSTVDVRVTSDTLPSTTSAVTSFTVPAAPAPTASSPSPSDDPALASTGAALSPLPVAGGVALLLAGLVALLVGMRRRGARRH